MLSSLAKSVYKAATELIAELAIDIDHEELKLFIDTQVKVMENTDFDDFEGPAGLSKHAEGLINLRNLANYSLTTPGCPPSVWVLYILSEIKCFTRQYLHYDKAQKTSIYSEGAPLTDETVRAFLLARSHYWFMDTKLAREGLAILGHKKRKLTPTRAEFATTKIALEEIADEVLLPGVLQSQPGWIRKGAADAYDHATTKYDYKLVFRGASLTNEEWSHLVPAWKILLQAALYRPLFADARTAYRAAERESISGYLEGGPTYEFVLLKENRLQKPVEEPDKLENFFGDRDRSAYLFREKLIELFAPEHAAKL